MFLFVIQLCIVAYGRGKSYLFYPLFCWLLDGVKIPSNVDGRTRSASNTFERVGFSDR